MFIFSLMNLARVIAHTLSMIDVTNDDIDAVTETVAKIEEEKADIMSTLHDTNIISFTVTGTTSGTVTYVRL